MANDIDMYNDLEVKEIELNNFKKEFQLLRDCYFAKYIHGNDKLADKLKDQFTKRYKYWGNWY